MLREDSRKQMERSNTSGCIHRKVPCGSSLLGDARQLLAAPRQFRSSLAKLCEIDKIDHKPRNPAERFGDVGLHRTDILPRCYITAPNLGKHIHRSSRCAGISYRWKEEVPEFLSGCQLNLRPQDPECEYASPFHPPANASDYPRTCPDIRVLLTVFLTNMMHFGGDTTFAENYIHDIDRGVGKFPGALILLQLWIELD